MCPRVHRARRAGGVFMSRGPVIDRRGAAARPSAAPPGELDRRPAGRRPRARAAGARGRHGLPGDRVRGRRRGRRRPRRQHLADRLPGGLHRPLVRRPGRRDDLPADRQLRPPRRRRPVASGRGSGRSSSRTPRPPSLDDVRQLASLLRDDGHPGDRRRRHAGARPAPPGERQPPGDRHGARVRRSRRGRRPGAGRAALGGPGLRRPGVAVVDHGRRPARRTAGR